MTELANNSKAAAWDAIGDLFWTKGRVSARPSDSEIDMFLEALQSDMRLAIIGASTVGLIERAVSVGCDVTVFDFSTRMCEALRNTGARDIEIQRLDITAPVPREYIDGFDAVLSDRLINRFTWDEATQACEGMLAMARPDGTVRASIKLGLYPMDHVMIEHGKQLGTVATFYDEATRTIDFSSAGNVLEACLMPHGDINRETMLTWYRGRGRERRFNEADVLSLFAKVQFRNQKFASVRSERFPDASETSLYITTVRLGTAACAESPA